MAKTNGTMIAAKPRYARHSVGQNINDARVFRERPELLHQSSSHIYWGDERASVSDEDLDREFGNGCRRAYVPDAF